jgi:hypothetical protein
VLVPRTTQRLVNAPVLLPRGRQLDADARRRCRFGAAAVVVPRRRRLFVQRRVRAVERSVLMCACVGRSALRGAAARAGGQAAVTDLDRTSPPLVPSECSTVSLVADRCLSRLGYRPVDARGSNVSSWGAPVVWDDATQLWHGWASEMVAGCGINAWETNSQIVHIVAPSPTGPFERRDVVWPTFAHEPSVTVAPNGSARLATQLTT